MSALSCGRQSADVPRDAGQDAAALADGALPPEAGSTADSPPAGDVGGPAPTAPVKAVAAGTNHTCAVHEGGRVSCWGYGPFIAPGLPAVVLPRPVDLPRPALAVEVGIQAACALLEGGAVSCWGDLGAGAAAPAAVVQEDGTPLAGVTAIAGGSLTFCGGGPTGIHCWGDNKGSALARPASLSFPPRTAVLADPRPRPAGALMAASVAIVTFTGIAGGTGELCGWGSNDSGIIPGPRGLVDKPSCRAGVTSVLSLSAGDGHVCARRGGATFSCWGSNSGGQLGTGDEDVLEAELPGVTRTLPAPVTALASAAYHSCAALTTGVVLCWGSNEHGELGRSPSAPQFSPQPVAGFSAKVLGLGAGAGAQHTCAILADGAVQCWGYDNAGQLGGGITTEDADRFSATPLTVRF